MTTVITVQEKIDILPFKDILRWERFQLFCTDLLYKTVNCIDSREFLRKGSNQQGIDVYAVKRGDTKLTVAQCKLEKYIGPSSITKIIEEFLKGDFVNDTSEFILCTNVPLNTEKDEAAIAKARKLLSSHNIDLKIWDEGGLSLELRTNASPELLEIVYHYFDEIICRHFFGDKWEPHLRLLKPVEKLVYAEPDDFIERSVTSYEDRLSNHGKNTWYHFNPDNSKNTLISVIEKNTSSEPARIILLSTAGFGKSKELQALAASFSPKEKPQYPLKFSLGNYEGEPIENILSAWSENWKKISQKNLLLILDGIDEIERPYLQSFFKKMNAFMELYPNVQAVVSSRYNFYEIPHQPLKGYKVFLLDPLTYADIHQYLDKQLNDQKDAFFTLLEEKKFSEYLNNPYYLTRLVRIFKDSALDFPNNKTDLFDRILFEQLTKDQGTYNIPELKKTLYPVASKVAFCMTLSGKSSLTDDELSSIIADSETRKVLNHFCILNRNESKLGVWTFEHKNLQEYLCASAFRSRTFEELHQVIAFELDGTKLLPRFLNTVSFLFELLHNNDPLFISLFNWINTNEPELLIRFEKEQISKSRRNDIFFRVFESYEEKGISLRASANFSLTELGRFVEVDETIVDYLSSRITTSMPLSLLYDAVDLLSQCQRAYTIKSKITAILFGILKNDQYPMKFKGTCIRSFYYLGFTEKDIFNKILPCPLDFEDIEIRKACLFFLEYTDYEQEYSDFIIGSIPILEKDRNSMNDVIKRLIMKFTDPSKIKQVLQFCVMDDEAISTHHRYREFQFTLEEFKILMENALLIYRHDRSILPIVYRLYCSTKYISTEKNWHDVFLNFFENTCKKSTIFYKFYKYEKRDHELLAFADEACCDFLISEHLAGRLTQQEMIIYRNILSHINWPMFQYFYGKLMELPNADNLRIEDLDIDYNQIRIAQETKNQQMLLDKFLFLEEAQTIFSIIDKDPVGTKDLWYPDNVKLRRYRDSIVIKAIRDKCNEETDKLISESEFLKGFESDHNWLGFVIDSIKGLLEAKNPQVHVRAELIEVINYWTLTRVDAIDFEKHTITDNPDGNYMYYPHTEFVKQCILLLNLDFTDDQLARLLFADYSSFYRTDQTEKTIISIIIKQFKDRARLREAVMKNIRNKKLSFRVHATHFKICQMLGYRECLALLYQMITENSFVEGYDRIKLSEIYEELGGQIVDFESHLTVPKNKTEEKSYVDWHWFLIEKLLHVKKDKIGNILKDIIQSDDLETNKLKAAENLIKLGRIEGLKFWLDHIKETKRFAFESRWESLYDYIRTMPFEETVDIFMEALCTYYDNNLPATFSGPRPIDESIYSSLISLAIAGQVQYDYIKGKLTKFIDSLSNPDYRDSVKYFLERLTYRYYESISQQIDIQKAALLYDQHLST